MFRHFLKREFLYREQANLISQVHRVNKAFEQEFKRLFYFNSFIISSGLINRIFITASQDRKNWSKKLLQSASLDGVAIVNSSGEVRFSSCIKDKEREFFFILNKKIHQLIKLLELEQKNTIVGLIPNFKMYSVVAVSNFKYKKQTYVFLSAYFFDKVRLKSIIEGLGSKLELRFIHKYTPELGLIVENLNKKKFFIDITISDAKIFWLKEDVFGNKSILFSICQNRSVFQQTQELFYFSFLFILVSLLFVFFIINFFLKKIVEKPISLINACLQDIVDWNSLKNIDLCPKEDELKCIVDKINSIVTKLKKGYSTLVDSFSLYSAIVEQSGDIIFLCDLKSKKILKYNRSFSNYFGYKDEEIHKILFYDLVDLSKKDVDAFFHSVSKKGSFLGEFPCKARDGKIFYVDLSAYFIELEDKQVISILAKDITEKKAVQKKMQYLAFHDVLTGLPNRLYFLKVAGKALEEVKNSNKFLGLIYIDVNDFKLINDIFGHGVGDAILVGVSKRLEEILREGDFIARLGGDEFVVLIKDLKKKEYLEQIAKKIIEGFKKPFLVDNEEIILSLSLGLSVFPEHGKTLNALLKSADEAMYMAKNDKTKEYVVFVKE
ncbi:sensor domain-containing diguanylate cyclase [Desulfonauticus submarinus]|uniref:sensor domain-containing diguanylate cyclase n=1 Tax=Desulfonauticus submarinus TaxID=206665 RepID=UPI0013563622|nr:sensor domain-containing diguanylate cyclase [Desulfonauticus submarinus]